MLRLSMKMYLALLWGISALFSMQSMSASVTETTKMSPTAEPIKTTKQLINAPVVHNETEMHSVTWQSTHKPAEVSVSATPGPTVQPKAIMEEAITMDRDSSNDSTTTLNSGPQLLHTSAAVTAAAEEAHIPHNTTISKTEKPTEKQSHRQSPTISADMISSAVTSATTSAAPLATDTVSSPEPTSSTKPEVTSPTSSTTSPPDFTQTPVFNQNTSSSPASTVSTTNPSEAGPVSELTSSPAKISETSASNSELSSTSQLVSVTMTPTSKFTDTGLSSSTTEPPTISFSTDSANTITTANSTSPAGAFIRPKMLPVPTISSTPATTTALNEASQSPSSTEVQSCSTRGVVTQCLIIVASLAVLATVFMVSTIILCTKLSARKYRAKKPQQATEMMCISALLPERNYTYTRQRNPVTNGVLVMHTAGDSDEDGGDNLTLSSFLPENDRLV
uniref:P-selectin glycoprotein ligand 1 n=1 Tax=Scatophagus argus TaxID=75038 RepID=UPI001ED7E882|nr:P-selectin glycoprotein ligand 1 [Scatophagus argus]XP_046231718.1 P-selectin glycoprotein ligand 1 [Scatophagus argus]